MSIAKRVVGPTLVALGILMLIVAWGTATPDVSSVRPSAASSPIGDALRGVSGGGTIPTPATVPTDTTPDPAVDATTEPGADPAVAATADTDAQPSTELAYTGTDSGLLTIELAVAVFLISVGAVLNHRSNSLQRARSRHLPRR